MKSFEQFLKGWKITDVQDSKGRDVWYGRELNHSYNTWIPGQVLPGSQITGLSKEAILTQLRNWYESDCKYNC